MPSPFACPAWLSMANVCSGQALYVTSLAPVEVVMTASWPVTLDAAVGEPPDGGARPGHTALQPV